MTYSEARHVYMTETLRQARNVRRGLIATGATVESADEQVEYFVQQRAEAFDVCVDSARILFGQPLHVSDAIN